MAEGLRKVIGNLLNPVAWLNNLRDHSIGFFTIDSTPTNGTSGTGFGKLGPGSQLWSTTTKVWYVNTGTKASPVWTAVDSATSTQQSSIVIPNALIKTLRASPVTLVTAPGAGLYVNPIDCVIELIYGGNNAFTANAGDNLALKWQNGTTPAILTGGLQAFLQGTANAYNAFVGPALASDINVPAVNVTNQPLVLHNIGAAEIAGNAANDNTLRVSLTYQIQPGV
jgi:hypothetical protein